MSDNSEAKSQYDDSAAFNRQFKFALFAYAIIEFIVIAFVIFYKVTR